MIRIRYWPTHVRSELLPVVEHLSASAAAAELSDDDVHDVAIVRIDTDEELLALEDGIIDGIQRVKNRAALAVAGAVFMFWQRDGLVADGDGWRMILRRVPGQVPAPKLRRRA